MACEIKQAYRTKREARLAKNLSKKKHHVKLKFYKCPDCRLWHLTKSKDNLDKSIEHKMMEMDIVSQIQSGQAIFVRKVSNQKTIFKVSSKYSNFDFIITYNKKHKDFTINNYIRKVTND